MDRLRECKAVFPPVRETVAIWPHPDSRRCFRRCIEETSMRVGGVSSASTEFSGPRVLVVEDEVPTRQSIVAALAQEGWNVAEASRGREMIAWLERQAFDLVILDWMLPGRDGLELLEHVRARGAHTPVLMLTVTNEVDDRVIGLESGAAATSSSTRARASSREEARKSHSHRAKPICSNTCCVTKVRL